MHDGVAVPTEAWHKSAKALHKADGESDTFLGDVPTQMPMFQWAGVGLSTEETYRTYLAMRSLQKAHGLLAVRFFGKIFGTHSDYVVVEARAPANIPRPPSAVGAVPAEPPGVGLNTFCYYVAASAADEFTLLEDVAPEQVVASPRVRKYVTGKLDAPVHCYPAFPGKEAALVRARIARIAAATVVYPVGKFAFDDESEASPKPMVDAEEYSVPDDLSAAESWVHAYGKILQLGRTTNPPRAEPEEGEDDVDAPEEEEETAALEPIGGDAPVMTLPAFGDAEAEELPAWTIKEYNTALPAYGVAIATSHAWPGAYAAIAKAGDKHACVYFGHGLEAAAAPFTPAPPPPILAECEEAEEGAEALLAEENALLKEIDEAKLAAENAEGDAPEE